MPRHLTNLPLSPALPLLFVLLLPLGLQAIGLHGVRVLDTCLLYVVLALGMNIVVGYAGLLDLGFIAFYAVGAYAGGLLASPHLLEQWPALLTWWPQGLHAPWWLMLPLSAALAAACGMLFGAPTLKLRGDYLAIVTLGFGEVVRLLMVNLVEPINLTGGAKGLGPIDPIRIGGLDLGRPLHIGSVAIAPVTLYAYLLLAFAAGAIAVSVRVQASRLGRAWMAMREDETAAEAMGLDVRRLKLAAFGLGAGLAGITGYVFGTWQVFISPEAFSLQESIMVVAMVVLGGPGRVPGVVIAALLLAGLPEALRYVVGPLQNWSDGRLDAGVLRPLIVAAAMVGTMLWRPAGLWVGQGRGSALDPG
ncbi:branched-chain amino acid ABC transporter permease [Ideonella sp. DXS29W]|uniref:Branched-chain amino acid ABC transporter permease n=1 Tax=Ideonella lacteola TaxID=2984193 RepID=A0ABU9BVL3_9BURK